MTRRLLLRALAGWLATWLALLAALALADFGGQAWLVALLVLVALVVGWPAVLGLLLAVAATNQALPLWDPSPLRFLLLAVPLSLGMQVAATLLHARLRARACC